MARVASIDVKASRTCSRPGCTRPAGSTLTYDYASSTAVLGPLAVYAEPHSYDLCDTHAARLTAPRGWDVIRLSAPAGLTPEPSADDIEALADAVREAAREDPAPNGDEPGAPGERSTGRAVGQGRRGHLRVLSSDS